MFDYLFVRYKFNLSDGSSSPGILIFWGSSSGLRPKSYDILIPN